MAKLGKYTDKSMSPPPVVSGTNGGNGGYERRKAMSNEVAAGMKMSKQGVYAGTGKWPRGPNK